MSDTHGSIEPAHILVVDDNEMNRDLLSRRLLRQGHTVGMACDGQEAWDTLQTEVFDLCLLDIMMPVMNGHELLQRIKADAALRDLPVILISALDDADTIASGIEMGADDHLPKPFNPAILRARVGASLAKKRLRDREQIYARSLEREMDIAHNIQASFLPASLPQVDGWELAAYFQPARRVGGDFYDAFTLHEGKRIAIVLADVCDKGVGAALFMALFRSLIRAQAERTFTLQADADEQVCGLLSSVNNYIARTHGDTNMFATVFMGLLDPTTGTLTYVNGGHEAPALCGAEGLRARLDPTGPAVGMMADMAYAARSATVAQGETLLVFTDGVTDARNPEGESFSEERILALLAQAPTSAHAVLQTIEHAVATHARDAAPFDDTTMLALRRQP